MTVTSGVTGGSERVSSAVSLKRFSVSPGVSASRGNSYQESSGSLLREKRERDQIDPQSSIPRVSALHAFHQARFTDRETRFGCERFKRRGGWCPSAWPAPDSEEHAKNAETPPSADHDPARHLRSPRARAREASVARRRRARFCGRRERRIHRRTERLPDRGPHNRSLGSVAAVLTRLVIRV